MTKRFIIACLLVMAVPAMAQTSVSTNTPKPPHTISIQEMLVTGPPQLKLHSLAMISQGKVKGGVDESFMPGFKVCAEDPAIPIRSVCARIIGQHMVAGKDNPNPEAVALLIKLAKDESKDVRFSAIYHGLTQMKTLPDDIVELLVEIAASHREPTLYGQISKTLKAHHEQVSDILDKKLETGSDIALFEIYEDLTGEPPDNIERYLEMPSSQPRMFIFRGAGKDTDTFKAELEAELKAIGVEGADVQVSGVGENYVLTVKTYITKDRLAVEKHFEGSGGFSITQDFWLTPELETQLETMKK